MKKNNGFWKAVFLSMLLVLFIAIQDVAGYFMFQKVGGFSGNTYQKLSTHYLQQFWRFSYTIIIIVGIVYYLLKNDLSESLAVIIPGITFLLFGLEDLLYYIIGGFPMTIHTRLQWLDSQTKIGRA